MRAAVIRLLFPLALLAGGVANARAAGELFELVGVHPEAAAQSTALGRMLVTLFGWRGQLYAGYGDFGANTGPISVTAWDPATGAFRSHWVSCTEAIYSYRVVADRLYAASTPRTCLAAALGRTTPSASRGRTGRWSGPLTCSTSPRSRAPTCG